jgi:outer membrane protein OmpA-like peptidoglycan-associated protein
VGVEAIGTAQVTGELDANEQTLQAMAGGRLHLTDTWIATAGAGVGLWNGIGTPRARALAGLAYQSRGKDPDPDRDGVLWPLDRCPLVPEDDDDFEDGDGCPESDNDQDGFLDPDDKCPNDPEDKDGFEDDDGCPDTDNDQDGIDDARDKCPDVPESKNGVQDDDGCPENDRDGDGLPDDVDACPDAPETKNGIDDEDGCPDEEERALVQGRLDRIEQQVFFATNEATLSKSSTEALLGVLQILREYPNTRLSIQGHADARGSEEYNYKLSLARANAVREHLIKTANPEDLFDQRLIVVGFGESQPQADNQTEIGLSLNRRVQFDILESMPATTPTD